MTTMPQSNRATLLDRLLSKAEEDIMVLTALIITVITAGEAINRYFIRIPLPWYEECVLFLYMMMTFWGSSRLARDNEHIRLEVVGASLRGRARLVYEMVISLACFIISIMGTYYSFKMSLLNSGSTAYLRIPNRLIFGLSLGLGFAAMTIRYGQRCFGYFRQLTSSDGTRQ